MEPIDRRALKVKACESCKKEFTLYKIPFFSITF